MEAVSGESNGMEQESSTFGIKKIVDCKIGDGGQQMYKVKWCATWEPAENLASCQHLIDEFWSFVNNAKTNDKLQQQHAKRMRQQNTNVLNIDESFDRMTEDNKAEIQKLIARANATSVGSQMLTSPSNMLVASPQQLNGQNNVIGMARPPPAYVNNVNFPNSLQMSQNMRQQNPAASQKSLNFGSPQQVHFGAASGGSGQQNLGAFRNKGNTPAPSVKVELDESKKIMMPKHTDLSKEVSKSDLKYLENFSNPYVKIILVCIKCNKELSMKFQSTWKRHYLTHVDDEEKPFKCVHCNKAFVQSTQLTSHMKKHAKERLEGIGPTNTTQHISPQPLGFVKTEFNQFT